MPLKKIGELKVNSQPASLAEVDRFTEKLIRKMPFPNEAQDDVAISISEAVNNAIMHGNRQDPQKQVLIRFYSCSQYLRIVVQDHGLGFTPNRVPDPRKEENLLKASGRGMLIMRHLMDRVVFRVVKMGMQVILEKRFPGGLPT
ncbi:MAG: ATP-binding protein [bacterium]|nr:ATP-binding protein [bacterium]